MSFPLHFDDVTDEVKEFLRERCEIKINGGFDAKPLSYTLYRVNKNFISIPIGLWNNLLDEFPNSRPINNIEYHGPLLRTIESGIDQDIVVKSALDQLKKKHTAFIAMSTGLGKTLCAIHLACQLKRKTLVLCHLSAVNKQWVDEFKSKVKKSIGTLKVSLVKDELNPDTDVHVMGILKANNFSRADFQRANIGTVILDEVHIAIDTCFTSVLLKIEPEYILGLSATPNRGDGLHKLYTPYFGDKKEYISRSIRKEEMKIVKISTGIVPEVLWVPRQGQLRIDWTRLQNSLSYHEERHKLIVALAYEAVGKEHNRTLILCGRIEECYSIIRLLEEDGRLTVSSLLGSAKNYDTSTDILVATTKKAGVGFNDTTLRRMILTVDCKDVRQFEGRLRVFDGIVYDIVDEFPTLEKHWQERLKWYKSRGSKIEYRNSTEEIEITPCEISDNLIDTTGLKL